MRACRARLCGGAARAPGEQRSRLTVLASSQEIYMLAAVCGTVAGIVRAQHEVFALNICRCVWSALRLWYCGCRCSICPRFVRILDLSLANGGGTCRP